MVIVHEDLELLDLCLLVRQLRQIAIGGDCLAHLLLGRPAHVWSRMRSLAYSFRRLMSLRLAFRRDAQYFLASSCRLLASKKIPTFPSSSSTEDIKWPLRPI